MWVCDGRGVERGGGFVAASGYYEVSADFVAGSLSVAALAGFVAAGVEVSIRRSAYCSLALAGLPLQKIEIS